MRTGQTLIEVMVALFVLTVGLLGILTLLSQSIFLSRTVGDQTIATYLASEGIELSKNLIDHNVYQNIWSPGSGGWNAGIGAGGDFELDYTTCDDLANPAATCIPPSYQGTFLSFDPTTNLYLYAYNNLPGDPLNTTKFQREIRVTPNAGDNELTVQSIVTWNVGLPTQQSLDLEDHFYNWLP